MEDKIEVGEYVRSKRGRFGICIGVSNVTGRYCQDKYLIQWSKTEAYYITKQIIAKHSKNIIDLIEEGDYVNGEPVEEIIYSDDEFEITTTTEYLTNLEDIKSIVTKEQFKQVQYEVGD